MRSHALRASLASAGYDSDAQTYITALEAADGDVLEVGVKDAINDFVVGCKADGIWSAIKASCIMAGARTLAGALVPLVGTAPTNFNFVSGDYNRETGLLGDGSTKYLDSNRANNADPQDSHHLAVYATDVGSQSKGWIGTTVSPGPSHIYYLNDRVFGRSRSVDNFNNPIIVGNSLTGISRASSSNWTSRSGGISMVSLTRVSVAPSSGTLLVFNRTGTEWANARFSFYSIGEALDLALLDARVSTLMTDIAAAIP